MELRHYHYFIAVAEELHFGRAARRLNIVQPALSMQIKNIEEMLGGKLFDRTKRSVKLTEAGHIFLQEARTLVEQDERARGRVKAALRGEYGLLQLAYSGNAALTGVLGRLIKSLKTHAPDVEVRLQEMALGKQLSALLSQKIHAALVTSWTLEAPDNIELIQLASWPLVIACPADHALAESAHISLANIREEPFVVFAEGDDSDSLVFMRRRFGFEPKVAYRVANIMLMLALVGAGSGLAILPESIRTVARQPGVKFVPLAAKPLPRMDCSLAYLKEEREPVIQTLIKSIPINSSVSTKPRSHK